MIKSSKKTRQPPTLTSRIRRHVHVVDVETGASVHVVTCDDVRRAEKTDAGMQHNLNHEKYFTGITDCPHDAIEAATCVHCVARVS